MVKLTMVGQNTPWPLASPDHNISGWFESMEESLVSYTHAALDDAAHL